MQSGDVGGGGGEIKMLKHIPTPSLCEAGKTFAGRGKTAIPNFCHI